jgi:hypothetical protein
MPQIELALFGHKVDRDVRLPMGRHNRVTLADGSSERTMDQFHRRSGRLRCV